MAKGKGSKRLYADFTIRRLQDLQYKVILKAAGEVFLLSSVWGVDFTGETRTVDVHIGTLRTKLEKAGDYIRTVRGVGYKLEEENDQ